jgi:hypothetical protein
VIASLGSTQEEKLRNLNKAAARHNVQYYTPESMDEQRLKNLSRLNPDIDYKKLESKRELTDTIIREFQPALKAAQLNYVPATTAEAQQPVAGQPTVKEIQAGATSVTPTSVFPFDVQNFAPEGGGKITGIDVAPTPLPLDQQSVFSWTPEEMKKHVNEATNPEPKPTEKKQEVTDPEGNELTKQIIEELKVLNKAAGSPQEANRIHVPKLQRGFGEEAAEDFAKQQARRG